MNLRSLEMHLFAILPLTFIIAGCGEQKAEIDTAGGDTEDTEDSSEDSDSGDTEDTDDTEIVGYPVDVTVDGTTVTVGLGGLETVNFEGGEVVTLVSVLGATDLKVSWADRYYDFLASDGFRPSEHSCPSLNYTTAQSGYLFPSSGNLVWEKSLGLSGCYFVDGVVEVIIDDAR